MKKLTFSGFTPAPLNFIFVLEFLLKKDEILEETIRVYSSTEFKIFEVLRIDKVLIAPVLFDSSDFIILN